MNTDDSACVRWTARWAKTAVECRPNNTERPKENYFNPPKTKIKYSREGPKPGHLGYKCQSKTRVTKFEVIVAQ
jgi:hypothetical protein